MAATCTAADRSSVQSGAGGASGGAARGAAIMLFRVTKALDRYRFTKRQIRPRFMYYLERVCEIPTRFQKMNERSYSPHLKRLTTKEHLV